LGFEKAPEVEVIGTGRVLNLPEKFPPDAKFNVFTYLSSIGR
jgi:hypothetical protein